MREGARARAIDRVAAHARSRTPRARTTMRANALKPRLDARAAPRGNALGRVAKPRRAAIATRSAGRRDDEDARDVSESALGVGLAVVAAVASAVVGAEGAEAYEAPVREGGVALSARGTRDETRASAAGGVGDAWTAIVAFVRVFGWGGAFGRDVRRRRARERGD